MRVVCRLWRKSLASYIWITPGKSYTCMRSASLPAHATAVSLKMLCRDRTVTHVANSGTLCTLSSGDEAELHGGPFGSHVDYVLDEQVSASATRAISRPLAHQKLSRRRVGVNVSCVQQIRRTLLDTVGSSPSLADNMFFFISNFTRKTSDTSITSTNMSVTG